jgi:hypothetical protein
VGENKSEVILVGYSNITTRGIVLHTNIPASLKSSSFDCKEFWVSWDRIGEALYEDYTTQTGVEERDALRKEYAEGSSMTREDGYKKLLEMAGCPKILIENPTMLFSELTEEDRQWAENVIAKREK